MPKTSVEIDRDIAEQAAAILGTTTLRDTIDASMREVVNAKRRLELIALLAQPGRFDFEAAEGAWGADAEVGPAAARYLADTSVFARLGKPGVATAFAPLAAQGRVAICAPIAFEIGFSARNPEDHRAVLEQLDAFPSVPVTDADHRRSIEVQGLLAARGAHRALSLVDALVAAVAEARGLAVLHYDADFELVASLTGQPHQWVVERGTAD